MARQFRRDFQRIQRAARVASAKRDQFRFRISGELEVELAESAFGIVERATHQRCDVLLGERTQHQHADPREQR